MPEDGNLTFENASITVIGSIDQKGNLQIGKENSESTIPEGLEIGSSVSYNPSGRYKWQAEYCSSDKSLEVDDRELDSEEGKEFNINYWKVLSINQENGKIEMVPSAPTKGTVYLGEAQGYNNGVKLLNDACSSLYADLDIGITARSINRKDIEQLLDQEKMEIAKANYTNTNSNYAHLTPENQVNSPYSEGCSYYPFCYGKEKLSAIDGNRNENGLECYEQSEWIGNQESGFSVGIN